MYFIVDGSAYILANDKLTIVEQLQKGDYFGMLGIFKEEKSYHYVQSENFSVMSCLTKNDFDNIRAKFP
jgi:signal-transduction protein with cAMP-binding, CBS, and nucleotidyltransferase domain